MLGEHLHHASVARELAAVVILGQQVGHPGLLRHLIQRLQAVRRGFVRPEHAEVRHVVAHDVAQERAERLRVLVPDRAGRGNLHRIVAKVRHLQILAQQAAVGVRIGAHAARALRRRARAAPRSSGRSCRTAPPACSSSARFRAASGSSGLSRTSENGTWCERHEPSALWPLISFGPVQPFGERSTIIGHRGRSAFLLARAARLEGANPADRLVERGRHLLMHRPSDRRLRRSTACSRSRRTTLRALRD